MIECTKILIPTLLPQEKLRKIVEEIKQTTGLDAICSCVKASASVNRNICIDRACLSDGDIVIMLDDDITGFYEGWLSDLVKPMQDANVVMASARLLRADGVTFNETCSQCFDAEPEEIEIKRHGDCLIPTAAISFRYKGIRFDESYVGSGWEDNDFCLQYLQKFPESKFIQSNRCRLIHLNEMKNQKGHYWERNVSVFIRKWGKNK